MLPWLIKEGVLVVFLSILSLIIFGFILFMTTDMTFRRISIKEYDGSYLFFTIISYTLVLLIAEGKSNNYLLMPSKSVIFFFYAFDVWWIQIKWLTVTFLFNHAVLSVCFWVEIYNLYDTLKRIKHDHRNDIELDVISPVQLWNM